MDGVDKLNPSGQTAQPAESSDTATAVSDVPDIFLDRVSKSYGTNHVLRRVCASFPSGSITCLMAPSGSGKTTLFRVLLGLEPADSGKVLGVVPGEVSMMFQEDRLCEVLTPVENVALVLDPKTRRGQVRGFLERILPSECMDLPVMQLSGGMRRRVSLVRAMAYPSKLVVLDEPFTGLDTQTRQKVISFILEVLGERTLLVATHGEDDARLLGARRVLLDDLQEGGSDGRAA